MLNKLITSIFAAVIMCTVLGLLINKYVFYWKLNNPKKSYKDFFIEYIADIIIIIVIIYFL